MYSALLAIVKGGPTRRLVSIAGLVLLLGLGLPSITLADPPQPAGADKCATCHEEETEAWQNSVHAKSVSVDEGLPGATCEACHGQYTDDHPGNDPMTLAVDSSICADCHASTFNQWENSRHAQAGVQCIGCHMSHSQELRLTDEALCAACHRDRQNDFADSVHGNAGVTCTNCHLASTDSHAGALAANGEFKGSNSAPNHDFTSVSSETCLKCHGQDIHIEKPFVANMDRVADVRLLAMADSVPELTTELETAQQSNRSLQTMTLVCLGLGMGIGGMLGIISTLVVGYVSQRRANR